MVKWLVRIRSKILPDPKSAIIAWTEDQSPFIDFLHVKYWGYSISHEQSADKKVMGIFLILAKQILHTVTASISKPRAPNRRGWKHTRAITRMDKFRRSSQNECPDHLFPALQKNQSSSTLVPRPFGARDGSEILELVAPKSFRRLV